MTQKNIAPADTLPIDNMHHLAALMAHWHQQKVAILKHMANIPKDMETQVNNETFTLSEDLHKGFVLGLTVALSEMGELPFLYETESEEPEPSADAAQH